ncbi:MAG: hypothetical protein HPY66_0604 [Firmicutes bacterium]|nr:hypothetical protein [Bacillota bacterium]
MSDKNSNNQRWGTRVGYIIAAAMAMAGLGNVWRFPNLVGRYGGAAFLIPYLILLFLVAIPGEWAEAILGKVTRKGTIGAYRAANKNLTGNGFITTILSTGVASYYVVICAWTFAYLAYAVKGTLMNADPALLWDSIYANGTGDMTWLIAIISVLILGLCCFVSVKGIKAGIEKVNKILAPCLFLSLIILGIRGLNLDGSSEGISFYMDTDWSMVFKPVTWIMALSQVLFSIGPNWGIYTTYARYMKKKDEMPLSYVTSCLADTSVALLAGWAIFPAVFAYGLDTTSGYSLAFVALSTVFQNMPGGQFFAIIFFLALFMAAVSTIFGFMEVGITNLTDEFKKKDRKTLSIILYAIIAALSIPAAFVPNWIDVFDTWVGCYILPIAMIILYVAVAYARNINVVRLKYLNCYSDIYVGKWWNFDIKYLQPLLVLIIWGFWIYSAVVEKWGFLLGVGGLAISIASCLLLMWLGIVYAKKHPGDAAPNVLD